MSTIVTRAGKSSPLTNTEVDANFTNLNTDKAELDTDVTFGSVGTSGDITITSATPELFFIDTSEAGAQGRVQATIAGLGYRSRASDDNGVPQFGNHTFARFDGTTSRTQMVLDPNNNVRVWNDSSQVRLYWDASHDNSQGGLAIGQGNAPDANLDVNGKAIIKTSLQIGAEASGNAKANLEFKNTLNESFSITASATGTTLTVSSLINGTINVGDLVYGTSSTPANIFIVQQLSGTTGGVGTYELSQSWEQSSVNLYGRDVLRNRIRFLDTDGNVRAGSPIGSIDFHDSDATNDGIKGFITCNSSDTSPSTHIAFGTNVSDNPFTPHAREVARFTEDGNLLVGKIDEGEGIVGHNLLGNGRAVHTSSQSSTLTLNRRDDAGGGGYFVTEYKQDNARCGFVATANGHITVGGGGNNGLKFSSTAVQPRTLGNGNNDAAIQLGTSASRFTDLHLSGGVYFADAGAAGTSTSNKLDNYEEGTFTPVLSDAVTGGGSANVGNALGFYTKIGDVVTATVALTNIDKSSVTQDQGMFVTGLPFASRVVTGDFKFVGSLIVNAVSFTNGQVFAFVQDNSTAIELKYMQDNGSVYQSLEGSAINTPNGSDIYLTITYKTGS
ncbi:hypothetical protein N9000_01020 [bacterium]|nr:hypothetical protein [bacterium]